MNYNPPTLTSGPIPISISTSNISSLQSLQSLSANGQISGLNSFGSSGQSLQYTSQGLQWGSTEKGTNELYKKYEIYEFTEDLLVLSCVSKRLIDEKILVYNDFILNNNVHGYESFLLNGKLFKNIKPQDRELADKIRDYYSKKIMMLKLQEIKLTSFRESLNTFIHNDGTKVKKEIFPLVYKLPEFYEYDIKFQEVLDSYEHNTTIDTKFHQSNNQLQLIPIKKIHKRTKSDKSSQYWFIDKDTSNLAMISVTVKNELENVFDFLFKNSGLLKVEGRTFVKNIDQNEYLSIKNWELLKI